MGFSVGAVACAVLAYVLWRPLSFPVIAVLIVPFAVFLGTCAVVEWWRLRESRRRPTPPIDAIVDEGLLWFGPVADGLIRDICRRGGRSRLEAAFDWSHAREMPLPFDRFVEQLTWIRDQLPASDAPRPGEGRAPLRFT